MSVMSGDDRKSRRVRASFLPLVDAAPLIAAVRLGIAADEGLDVQLERETSWASVRDRLAVGHLDAGHVLAPMPIAANLQLAPLSVRMVAPIALGYGGNTITVSLMLWDDLRACGVTDDLDAHRAGTALAAVVRARSLSGRPKVRLGVVHSHSAHYYQVCYWLAAVGIDPINDVDILVVAPRLTTEALSAQQIDGFCAGEPWGSLAVSHSVGHVLTTNTRIWWSSPEKVLGLRQSWVEEDLERTSALIRAIYRAALWCDVPENRPELSRLLSAPEVLDLPAPQVEACLSHRGGGWTAGRDLGDGFLSFATRGASFPWTSHAVWFYSQMVRWRQAAWSENNLEIARSSYRPDIYRAALKPLGVDLPSANSKIEGGLPQVTAVGSTLGKLFLGPDTFFDGVKFDPDRVADYLQEQARRA